MGRSICRLPGRAAHPARRRLPHHAGSFKRECRHDDGAPRNDGHHQRGDHRRRGRRGGVVRGGADLGHRWHRARVPRGHRRHLHDRVHPLLATGPAPLGRARRPGCWRRGRPGAPVRLVSPTAVGSGQP
ncbi:hypothetical protein XE97_25380, partial [Salmonella enterica subsp. enterica serovar Senftenberg]|nr:hypothetical protein [Salmonella enterica subsp. enterica serovar Senftenberg]